MKKNYIIAALICIMAASCEVDPIQEIKEAAPETLTFQTKGEILTKTVMGENNTINWLPSDCINIFDINPAPCQGAMFTNNLTEPASSAVFGGTCNKSAVGYMAVYPYTDNTNDDEHGFMDLNEDGVPETIRISWAGNNQLAAIGSFRADKTILVAKSEGNILAFKHALAYISVTTTFSCEEIIISGANDEILACLDVDVKWVDGLPVASCAKPSPRTNDVAVNKPDSDPVLPGEYIVAVLPQTLANGFTLTFKNHDGSTTDFTKTTTNSATLERGKILDLGTFSSEDFISTGEWAGSGTKADPYLITSLEQLRKVGERVNGKNSATYKNKYYKLANDIDCNHDWVYAIGDYETRCFEGTFDGDGHRIYNYIASACYEASGLFGNVKNATIKNLTVEVAGIKMNNTLGEYFHAFSPLVAESYSGDGKLTVIENVKVKTYIPDEVLYFSSKDIRTSYGSIVGWSNGSIKILNCEASVNVDFNSHSHVKEYQDYNIGGIIGMAHPNDEEGYCIIDRCRNTGNISVEYLGNSYGGGIIGCDTDQNEDVTTRVTNCVNEGNVLLGSSGSYVLINAESRAGGIIGNHDSDGDYSNGDPIVYNCLNKGKILANGSESYTGGIIGYCYDNDTDLYCCVNTGQILCGHDPHYGALCGTNSGSWYYSYWVKKSSYDIVGDYGNGGYNSSNCSAKTAFTADELNAAKGHIPSNPGGYSYCNWIIDAEDGLPDISLNN